MLVALTLTANGVQIISGNTRASKSNPLFLSAGLFLAVSICAIALLPRTHAGLSGLIFLAVISGCGIAITHPESLRAIHALSRIPSAISTSIFMTGGFLGFASAGAISTVLVSRFGLRGLYILVLCPVVGVVALKLLRIRLAVESEDTIDLRTARARRALPFWSVMVMAQPAAIGITVLATLLPTLLNELGFELTFGGYSSTMYAGGAAAGAFIWGTMGHKKGELPCCITAFLLTTPFLVAYILLAENRWAIWLLFGAGSCSIPAYVLIVTLARSAAGLNLGLRMGLVVGGTWGFANIVFMALAPVAERFGTGLVIKISLLGFPISAVFGILLAIKYKPLPLRKQ